jgi:hypothetical protein
VRAKQYFYSVLVPLLVCFYYSAGAQNIVVRSKLDKNSMPIGAQTVLHVSAHIPAKSVISFPLIKDSIGKIKIVSGPKPDSASDKNDPAFKTVTQNYTITSFDEGVYTIPAFEFHTAAGVFKSDTVKLQIKPVLVDTTKVFYDIKQPFAVHYTFWDWLRDHWLLVVLILTGIVLAMAIIFYLRNRPKGTIVKKAAPILTIDAIALNKLYVLRDKKLWQQNEIKLYYIELTDILREYLEKRYRIRAHEQTTGDILSALKDKDMHARAKDILKQLLTIADLVKFAKEEPIAAENEQKMEYAIEFIRQTREELPL